LISETPLKYGPAGAIFYDVIMTTLKGETQEAQFSAHHRSHTHRLINRNPIRHGNPSGAWCVIIGFPTPMLNAAVYDLTVDLFVTIVRLKNGIMALSDVENVCAFL